MATIHKIKTPLLLNKHTLKYFRIQWRTNDEFHYEYIKNKYDKKSRLFLINTDSLSMKLKLKKFITMLEQRNV